MASLSSVQEKGRLSMSHTERIGTWSLGCMVNVSIMYHAVVGTMSMA